MTSSSSPSDLLADFESSARSVIDLVGPSTVSVGRNGRGSGVVIAQDRVLTNAHNLRDRTTSVTLSDGTVAQGSVVGADGEADLVVLDVPTGDVVPVEWAETPASSGSVVFSVARSSRGARVTFGLISGTDRVFRGPGGRRISQSLEHTAPMARGSSGGPLVDRNGHLVGLNTHRIGDGFYLAQSATSDLRGRVDALASGRSPRTLRLGIAIAPAQVAAKLRASVGLVERDGLLIRGVETDGPAAAAGIAEGDLIVAAGGRPVASPDDLFDALAGHDDSTPLSVDLVRGADELTVDVTFPAE